MIPLTHPVIRDYLTAARTQPADSEMVRVYLFDRLADVGGFGFVGDPTGPTLADACLWYARCEDEDEPALRMALAEMDEVLHPNVMEGVMEKVRAQQVRAMSQDVQLFVNLVQQDDDVQRAIGDVASRGMIDLMTHGQAVLPRLRGNHPAVQAAENRARATIRRDLRRRVLALYTEVEVTVQCELSRNLYREPPILDACLAELFAVNGSRLDLDIGRSSVRREADNTPRWIYTRTLTAPDLIPPEPEFSAETIERARRWIGHLPPGQRPPLDTGQLRDSL